MSALTEAALPKEVIMEWRKFAGTSAFQLGIDWLRHNRVTEAGDGDMQLVKAAAKWKGYMEALDDVQDTLTSLPKKVVDIDEPGLEAAISRE